MCNLPIPLLDAFRPTPKTILSNSGGLVGPKIFVQIESVAFRLVNHEPHFMRVLRGGFGPCNFRSQVCRSNFALTHSHVTHLRSAEAYAISHSVNSFVTPHAHVRIDVYVPIGTCDFEDAREGSRTNLR